MKFMKYFLSALVSLILSINVAIAEKWDMALAYGAGNFHSANAAEFAENVTKKSGEVRVSVRVRCVACYMRRRDKLLLVILRAPQLTCYSQTVTDLGWSR